MTEEDKQFIEQAIKEAHLIGLQAGKKESSDLVADVKITHKELKTGIDGINNRLDKLNGSVAKHADKFSGQDILNAQVTITQQQFVNDLIELKKSDKEVTNFMLKSKGSIDTFKWLFAFVGFGTLLTFLKVFGIIMK